MRTNINGVIGELDTLQGCTQVAVSHSVFLEASARGNGKAIPANWARQKLVFEELGYDMMICTVDQANERQRHILKKSGWTWLDEFISRKTGHVVELWSCKPNDT